jgi:hypothetical protein
LSKTPWCVGALLFCFPHVARARPFIRQDIRTSLPTLLLMGKNKYYVEALSRGLQILGVFSEQSPSLSLTEIASSVGLDKSTTFRFAHTLEMLGYLERDAETKQYPMRRRT